MEGLNFPGAPSSCDPNVTDQQVNYDVNPYYYEWDHNPYWYFTNETSTSECNNVVPYPGSTGLLSTLDGPNPPDFVQISPNACDDGHGELAPASCQYSETEESDLWFQGATNLEGVTPALTCPSWCLNLPAILSSSWYQSGGIIVITWDEAPNTDLSGGGLPNTNGGQIATIVISANSHGAFAPAGNDYGILRAIEEAYGFTPLGNAANSANGDLSGAFDNAGNSGSISGAVTDSITHAGIVGASVTCTGSPTCIGTTTGAGGTYTLSNLAAGTYTVQASVSGYGTLSQPDTVTTGAAPPDNFNLIPNAGTISGTVDGLRHPCRSFRRKRHVYRDADVRRYCHGRKRRLQSQQPDRGYIPGHGVHGELRISDDRGHRRARGNADAELRVGSESRVNCRTGDRFE